MLNGPYKNCELLNLFKFIGSMTFFDRSQVCVLLADALEAIASKTYMLQVSQRP